DWMQPVALLPQEELDCNGRKENGMSDFAWLPAHRLVEPSCFVLRHLLLLSAKPWQNDSCGYPASVSKPTALITGGMLQLSVSHTQANESCDRPTALFSQRRCEPSALPTEHDPTSVATTSVQPTCPVSSADGQRRRACWRRRPRRRPSIIRCCQLSRGDAWPR